MALTQIQSIAFVASAGQEKVVFLLTFFGFGSASF